MTEFEKGVYADMDSAHRVLTWMIKAIDLHEFMKLMTEEDIELLGQALKSKNTGGNT